MVDVKPAAHYAHKHCLLPTRTSTGASHACRRPATWIAIPVHGHSSTRFAGEEEVLLAVQTLEPKVPDGIPAAVVAAPAEGSCIDPGLASAVADVLTGEGGLPQNHVLARIADSEQVAIPLDDMQFKCTHMAVVVLAALAHKMVPVMVMPGIHVIVTASHCHE